MIIFKFTPEEYRAVRDNLYTSNYLNFIRFDSTQTWVCRCLFFDYIRTSNEFDTSTLDVSIAILYHKLRFI